MVTVKLSTRILNWLFPSKLPPVPRTDTVLSGFYASDANQPAEVADFTDIHWESMLFGEALTSIANAARPTVIDLSPYLYDGVSKNHTLAPDAEQRLLAFRRRLELAGLMRYIWAIYPMDEPDLNVPNPDHAKEASIIARRVFPGVMMAVIFSDIGAMERYNYLDYDLVGFDQYGPGAGIFDVTIFPLPPMSDYDRFARKILPHQRIIIVPPGFDPHRQDPTPFYAMAAKDGRILIVLAFLWYDLKEDGKVSLGIRSNGMADAYRAAYLSKQQISG